MNTSKKHKKHIKYTMCSSAEDIAFYNHCRGKKNRKAMHKFRCDIRTGEWQKRVFKASGIKLPCYESLMNKEMCKLGLDVSHAPE